MNLKTKYLCALGALFVAALCFAMISIISYKKMQEMRSHSDSLEYGKYRLSRLERSLRDVDSLVEEALKNPVKKNEKAATSHLARYLVFFSALNAKESQVYKQYSNHSRMVIKHALAGKLAQKEHDEKKVLFEKVQSVLRKNSVMQDRLLRESESSLVFAHR
ncbi:MAG: hypothetical protein HQL32_12655, partial [Planctomycetes bacterium]|nr:hypothetical protein [Planctomycetota bacterium]